MIIENAITHLFDRFGAIADHYGQDKARLMCEQMLNKIPLDKNSDSPLPKWAMDVLFYNGIGYRERLRVLLMHQSDITGKPIEHGLIFKKIKNPNWVKTGSRKSGAKWVKVMRGRKSNGSTDSEVKG